MVKNLQCRRPGFDPLEQGMATHCSILAWRIPWTEEPGGPQPIGLQSWTPLKQGSSQPRDQTLSLPAEPQGKPKNTGVGSLSLLQEIFPIQESNWGLLHCRQILYQLSYEASPIKQLTHTILCRDLNIFRF